MVDSDATGRRGTKFFLGEAVILRPLTPAKRESKAPRAARRGATMTSS